MQKPSEDFIAHLQSDLLAEITQRILEGFDLNKKAWRR